MTTAKVSSSTLRSATSSQLHSSSEYAYDVTDFAIPPPPPPPPVASRETSFSQHEKDFSNFHDGSMYVPSSPTSTSSPTLRSYEMDVENRFREQNVLYGKDVIQVPLKVEDTNEYVNLVLSHREFDIMAVHIQQYDEMRPSALIEEITRLVKESENKKKLKQSLMIDDANNSMSVFQARILELEYELKRLNTKLAAARSLQASLTDENTALRMNIRELEQNTIEYEKLYMQNELLREQALDAVTEVNRMKQLALDARCQLQEFTGELNLLRNQVIEDRDTLFQTTQDSFSLLIEDVHARETILQESYLEEKMERQLIAEKYYELSGRIRVFCRVRPPTSNSSQALMRPKPNSLLIEKSAKEFTFDQVFGPECTQTDVYDLIEPLVVSFSDGYNACIMAYGQTGSGKTHTMMGNSDGENDGMIPRALKQVFAIVDARQLTYKDSLKVSMVEIYNDQILDLLSEDSIRGGKNAVIKNENNISARNVTVWSHVNDVLAEGNANRSIASTSMNVQSSRSHALVFLHLESQHRSTLETRKSTLCLVDLAGSERISRSQVEDDRLKETQYINKSLSALGDVVYALQHKAKHVPYRNSKLTYMLRDMLSGQAKTLLMLQLSPDDVDIEETTCSLNFGARVSQVQMGAVRPSVESGELFKLKDDNRALEGKLRAMEEQMREWKEQSHQKANELEEIQIRNQELEQQVRQQAEELAQQASMSQHDTSLISNASSLSPSEFSERIAVAPSSPTLSAKSTRSTSSVRSLPARTPTRVLGARTLKGTSSATDRILDEETRRKSLSTLTARSTLAARERSLRSSREAPPALPSTRKPLVPSSSSPAPRSAPSSASRLASMRSTLSSSGSQSTHASLRRPASTSSSALSSTASTSTVAAASPARRTATSRIDTGRRLSSRTPSTTSASTPSRLLTKSSLSSSSSSTGWK